MYDCVREETNASNGSFGEQDGMTFRNDCQNRPMFQFREEIDSEGVLLFRF